MPPVVLGPVGLQLLLDLEFGRPCRRTLGFTREHSQHLLCLGPVVSADIAQDRRMADAEHGGDRAYRHALSAHRGGFASAPVAFRSAAHTAYGTFSFHSGDESRTPDVPKRTGWYRHRGPPPNGAPWVLMSRPGRRRETIPHPPDLPRPLPILLDLPGQRPPFVRPGAADDRSFQGQHCLLDLCQLGQRLVPRGNRLVPLDLPGQATDGDDILHRNARHAYFEALVGTPERKAGQVGDADCRKLPKGTGRHSA